MDALKPFGLFPSASMGNDLSTGGGEAVETRWDIAKDTVKKILTTLDNFNDYVNIVVFDADARPLRGDVLIKASESNAKELSAALENVTLAEGVDNNKAFNVVFDLFENTFRRDEDAKICQNVGAPPPLCCFFFALFWLASSLLRRHFRFAIVLFCCLVLWDFVCGIGLPCSVYLRCLMFY